jgi:hypothetical protein
VADDRDFHVGAYALPMRPEELRPLAPAEEVQQCRVVALHDRAALIEDGEQIAQPAAPAAFARDLGGVHGVDARLGARKREPGEGVEEVVQALGPRLHATSLEHLYLVVAVFRAWRNEAHGLAAFGVETSLGRQRVQPVEGPLAGEPGPYRVEDRLR